MNISLRYSNSIVDPSFATYISNFHISTILDIGYSDILYSDILYSDIMDIVIYWI